MQSSTKKSRMIQSCKLGTVITGTLAFWCLPCSFVVEMMKIWYSFFWMIDMFIFCSGEIIYMPSAFSEDLHSLKIYSWRRAIFHVSVEKNGLWAVLHFITKSSYACSLKLLKKINYYINLELLENHIDNISFGWTVFYTVWELKLGTVIVGN